MEIYNVTKKITLAEKAVMADRFLSRLVGLLNRKTLNKGEGLVLKPCKAVHTWSMRFAIDVAFLDKDDKVIYIIQNMVPGKKSPYFKKSTQVIELPVGTLSSSGTELDDIILCQEV